jgi:hypothetical protein
MKRKMLWVDTQDEEAAKAIMQLYGCKSESAAFRLAVRVLAKSPVIEIPPIPQPKHARPSPKYKTTGKSSVKSNEVD